MDLSFFISILRHISVCLSLFHKLTVAPTCNVCEVLNILLGVNCDMYLSFPNKSISMLILLLMNLYKFQSPFSAIGSRLIIFRLLGCNSGNCNKPRRNHRRASRRTTGRAGRGLPWKLPVHRESSRKPPRYVHLHRTPPSHSC